MSKLIMIPAMDKEVFGYINQYTDIDQFTKRGHIPIQLKVKDHRFVVFVEKQRKQTKLMSQINTFGKHPVVTTKIEHQCKVTLSMVDFESESSNINLLYEDFITRVHEHVEIIGGMYKDGFKAVLDRRLDEHILFAVEYWVTRNVASGATCLWEWRPVAGTDGKQDKKLVMTEVDGEKTENFNVRTLRSIANGMWADECETFHGRSNLATTMCAGMAQKKGIMSNMPKV